MKTKKIIKVLKFINDYCRVRDCGMCKFSNQQLCNLSDGNGKLPESWDVEAIERNLKDIEKIKRYKK